ncbi:uncharacterized protein EV420DRAFT_1689878 [Desarmillaria tabescens]|uniref:Uncharacterized protein n=1 Tax=Armillaria tabescens TaxID=1929756 RepID=A0AA39KAH6_ARMTA|nr:uncharacterized protein EV420DRAFT_1689878 [Desarmillaria tabescens]KAK0457268.1 hypothetical protein EV420DRAFT_1689878 [Desarmillaria tabescens]
MYSDVPVPIAATLSLDMTMGAIFVGVMISAMLYGISVHQLAIYYRLLENGVSNFPRFSYDFYLNKRTRHDAGLPNPNTDDTLKTRGSSDIQILDTIQLGLAILALYFYLVTYRGNYQVLLQLNWSIRSQYPFSMASDVGVQALYAVRIWKFCLCRGFVGLHNSSRVNLYGGPYNLLNLPSIRVPLYIPWVATATTDLVIAGITCFYLHKGKEITRRSSTIKIITALMPFVVMSGLMTW